MSSPRRVVRFRKAAIGVLGAGLFLIPFAAGPVGAATPPTTTPPTTLPPVVVAPSLAGGAIGTGASLNLDQDGTFVYAKPQVVTPPAGGSKDASDGGINWGGFPPFIPPFIVVGPSTVHTDGTIAKGGVFNYPLVNSNATLHGLRVFPNNGGIDFSEVDSTCRADDPPVGPPTLTSSVFIKGTIMGTTYNGTVSPNTRVLYSIPNGSQPALKVTVVLNEVVPGQSADHHKGILVNAVHVYLGTPPATYTNAGAVWSESRCETDVIPIPPAIVPQAPLAAVLPLSAVGIGGIGLLGARARGRRHATA